eukprot:7303271-Ditylum_brightwellii.AAC.1
MPGDVLSASTKICLLDISLSATNSSVCRCLNRRLVTDHFRGVLLSPTSSMVTLHPHRGRVSQIEGSQRDQTGSSCGWLDIIGLLK